MEEYRVKIDTETDGYNLARVSIIIATIAAFFDLSLGSKGVQFKFTLINTIKAIINFIKIAGSQGFEQAMVYATTAEGYLATRYIIIYIVVISLLVMILLGRKVNIKAMVYPTVLFPLQSVLYYRYACLKGGDKMSIGVDMIIPGLSVVVSLIFILTAFRFIRDYKPLAYSSLGTGIVSLVIIAARIGNMNLFVFKTGYYYIYFSQIVLEILYFLCFFGLAKSMDFTFARMHHLRMKDAKAERKLAKANAKMAAAHAKAERDDMRKIRSEK
ncbi:MAG: hypothetical protein ACI4DS_00255 [Eubacterium sp.]